MSTTLLKAQTGLNTHPLFGARKTPQELRFFMESHVYAVWDFMSLLKRLQQDITCVSVPWRPSPYPASMVRFINQIVLGEESDVGLDSEATSHFDLYLRAMDEVGASTNSIRAFVETMDVKLIPEQARGFTEFTLKTAREASTVEVAAAFFYGREKLIPGMFDGIIGQLKKQQHQCATLMYYLERHVQVDGEEHGPLSEQCLDILCKNNPQLRQLAESYGLKALAERQQLWDLTLSKMRR